jgi:hypothetical protein
METNHGSKRKRHHQELPGKRRRKFEKRAAQLIDSRHRRPIAARHAVNRIAILRIQEFLQALSAS